MKELLKQYAEYNIWATKCILDVLLALPQEKQEAELPSSFGSLYKTVLHMWDAESIWWQRVQLQERLTLPSENCTGTMADISNGLLAQSRQWEEWISNASDMSLNHVFQYYTTKRELFKMPVHQTLLHVFNHGTYHRGQLINMLRQLGEQKLPHTDFVVWARHKK